MKTTPTPPQATKTAAQINTSQLGAAEPAPAAPATPIPSRREIPVRPSARAPIPGWWSISKLTGGREGVLAAIAKSDAPDAWKAALTAQIESAPPEFNDFTVDAHAVVHGNTSNFTLTVKRAVRV